MVCAEARSERHVCMVGRSVSGTVARFNISSGVLDKSFNVVLQDYVVGEDRYRNAATGMCVFNELTAGREDCADGIDNDGNGKADKGNVIRPEGGLLSARRVLCVVRGLRKRHRR